MASDLHPFHTAFAPGPATLRVADSGAVGAFYREALGMDDLSVRDGSLTLGVAETPLVVLLEDPGAPPAPRGSSGLFHLAFLVPERADLSAVMQRLAIHGLRPGGADHLVSEAIYLTDPEGNGIEIYRDRPAGEWPRTDRGRLEMATQDQDPALATLATAEAGLPVGTVLGHIHLRVGDLAKAIAFYRDLGLDLSAVMPGAAFLGAGGYHHHIGLNTWQSAGGRPAPPGSLGLVEFALRGALVGAESPLVDPSGARIRLVD